MDNYLIDETFNKRFHIDKTLVNDIIRDNFTLWYGEGFQEGFKPLFDAKLEDYPNILSFEQVVKYNGNQQSTKLMKKLMSFLESEMDYTIIPASCGAITGFSFEEFIKQGYFDNNYFAFWQLFKMKDYNLDLEDVLSQLVAGDIEIILMLEEIEEYIDTFLNNLKNKKHIRKSNLKNIQDSLNRLFIHSTMNHPEQIKQFLHERSLVQEMITWLEEGFLSDVEILPNSFIEKIAQKEKEFSLSSLEASFHSMKKVFKDTIKTQKNTLKKGLVFLPEISSALAYYATDDKKQDNILVVYIQNIFYEVIAKYYTSFENSEQHFDFKEIEKILSTEELHEYAKQLILTTLLHEYAHSLYKRIDFHSWRKVMRANKLKISAYSNESAEEEYCEIFSYYWTARLLGRDKELDYYYKNFHPDIFSHIFAK